jgi:glucose-6-phosphate 1-dehydrogenase
MADHTRIPVQAQLAWLREMIDGHKRQLFSLVDTRRTTPAEAQALRDCADAMLDTFERLAREKGLL